MQFPTISRIAFPIVLTLVVYVVYHTVAIRRKHGVLNIREVARSPGLPGGCSPIMFVLEVLTYFIIRPLTLALRLFGNMLAGHLMLLVFILGGGTCCCTAAASSSSSRASSASASASS